VFFSFAPPVFGVLFVFCCFFFFFSLFEGWVAEAFLGCYTSRAGMFEEKGCTFSRKMLRFSFRRSTRALSFFILKE